MDFSKSLHGSVKIDTWISLCCYRDLPKLFMDFLKLLRGFGKVFFSISCSLPNKTKVKCDKDFEAC